MCVIWHTEGGSGGRVKEEEEEEREERVPVQWRHRPQFLPDKEAHSPHLPAEPLSVARNTHEQIQLKSWNKYMETVCRKE